MSEFYTVQFNDTLPKKEHTMPNDTNVPTVILNRNAEALGAPRAVPSNPMREWARAVVVAACAVADAADLAIEVRDLGASDQSPPGYHRIGSGVHERNGSDTVTAGLMVKTLDDAAKAEREFWAQRTYHVAVMLEATGEFEILETFNADDDADANAYAERNHSGRAWYVLNENRRNINAGVDRYLSGEGGAA
jgi:hypothetical protein